MKDSPPRKCHPPHPTTCPISPFVDVALDPNELIVHIASVRNARQGHHQIVPVVAGCGQAAIGELAIHPSRECASKPLEGYMVGLPTKLRLRDAHDGNTI